MIERSRHRRPLATRKLGIGPLSAAIILLGNLLLRAEVSADYATVTFDGTGFSRDAEMTIIGAVTTPDSMDLDFSRGAACLTGMRINGRANQDAVNFSIVRTARDCQAPELKDGTWCEVKGHWRDAKLSGPQRVVTFSADTVFSVPAAALGLADFSDRACHFEGIASAGGRCTLTVFSKQTPSWALPSASKTPSTRWPRSAASPPSTR